MTQPTDPEQSGSTLSKEMRDAAYLTSLRSISAERSKMWQYFKRNAETLYRLYQHEGSEETLLKWLKKGQETAAQRIMLLDEETSGYDEILTNLTAKLAQQMKGDDIL